MWRVGTVISSESSNESPPCSEVNLSVDSRDHESTPPLETTTVCGYFSDISKFNGNNPFVFESQGRSLNFNLSFNFT